MLNLLGLSDLPYVSLVKGNLSEEDRDGLLVSLTAKYAILDSDIFNIHSLNAEASKSLKHFIGSEPIGQVKLAVIDLDKSTTQAQNSLLAILESPPARVKFLLFSRSPVLTTVESRSEVFCSSSVEVVDAQSKAVVLSILKAAKDSDQLRADEVLKNWDEKCHKLLLEWAIESKLRKPGVFSEEELLDFSFPKGFEDSLILALSVLDSARPRLSVKSIFSSYIEKNG